MKATEIFNMNRILELEAERDRLKEAASELIESGAKHIHIIKDLQKQLQARDEALSAAKKLRLCFPETVEKAEFTIPRYIIDEFDEALKAVETAKEDR